MTTNPEHTDILIIGAGFSGLGTAIELKLRGRNDYLILEKANEVGGTWRDNTYPGAACDIPSHLYSFSRDLNPDWSRMYPQQREIWEYQRRCVEKYDLKPKLRFGCEVTTLRFDEAKQRWNVTCANGKAFTARVIVAGMGGLHIPRLPELDGTGTFAGPAFHTAQWDHSVDLTGKRVGIIGSGASAIQIVPEIAKLTEHLFIFQRTPSWIVPKGDRAMAGIEKWLFRHAPPVQRLYRWLIYWINEVRAIGFTKQPERMVKAERQARQFIASQIPDPVLRKKVSPNYTIGCKRVLISNDFYPALNRENVELETTAIRKITSGGLELADGREVEIDVLIYATGFNALDIIQKTQITGRHGRSLNAEWGDTPFAHRGMTVSGYPNLFFLMGPNTGLGHNSIIYMIESGIAYIMDALDQMDQRNAASLDVREDAQSAFLADIRERLKGTVWATGCKSWYINENGDNPTLWPDFTFRYRKLTSRLDAENYEFTPRQAQGEAAA